MEKCYHCGKKAVHIGEPDPYCEVINKDTTPRNMCRDCYQVSLDEI